jgi:hypothetical protein
MWEDSMPLYIFQLSFWEAKFLRRRRSFHVEVENEAAAL